MNLNKIDIIETVT